MAIMSTFASTSFSGILARSRGTCAFCVVYCVAVGAGGVLVLESALMEELGTCEALLRALLQEGVEVSGEAGAGTGSQGDQLGGVARPLATGGVGGERRTVLSTKFVSRLTTSEIFEDLAVRF